MTDVFVRFIELHVFKIVQEFHQATFPNNFEPLNYRAWMLLERMLNFWIVGQSSV